MALYKIVKVMRKTGNRKTIEKDLSLDEARRYIKNDQKENPISKNSMLTYTIQ